MRLADMKTKRPKQGKNNSCNFNKRPSDKGDILGESDHLEDFKIQRLECV